MQRTSRVAALLFASGFCALVYQVAWLREFRLIFGASTAASAAVVAIFIGGLGFGGGALNRFEVDHWPLAAFKQKALTLATILAAQKPSVARPLYDVLMKPFAIRSADGVRLYTAARLAAMADLRGLCRAPIAALEPDVPWREDLLRLRADCYRATGDALLTAATRDLNDFLAGAPQPIVSVTPGAPAPRSAPGR